MDENNISGMHIYYYYVCKRKLWYFSNGLAMESENENVKIGKLIDETTYKQKKKHIMIDNTINIDFITERGVEGIKGRIDYPLLKQSLNVELSEEDERELESAAADIVKIISAALPPKFKSKRICKSCAYYDLCCI